LIWQNFFHHGYGNLLRFHIIIPLHFISIPSYCYYIIVTIAIIHRHHIWGMIGLENIIRNNNYYYYYYYSPLRPHICLQLHFSRNTTKLTSSAATTTSLPPCRVSQLACPSKTIATDASYYSCTRRLVYFFVILSYTQVMHRYTLVFPCTMRADEFSLTGIGFVGHLHRVS